MIAATGRYLGQRSSMGCQRDLAKSGVFPRSSIVLWFLFDWTLDKAVESFRNPFSVLRSVCRISKNIPNWVQLGGPIVRKRVSCGLSKVRFLILATNIVAAFSISRGACALWKTRLRNYFSLDNCYEVEYYYLCIALLCCGLSLDICHKVGYY